MVAVIKTSSSIRGILNYNENKVEIGKAECISAVNYPLKLEKLNFTSKLNRFLKLAELNTNAKRNTVHISLNFDPSENHSKEKLAEIADTYMEKLGFGRQPYLVYQHHDAGHPHCHIVTNNIQRDGKRIDLHLLGIRKSEPARKEIEEMFGLVKAEGRKQKEQFSLNPIDVGRVQYGKAESRKAINSVLNQVLFDYKYSSLPELNAVLNLYYVHADRGSEESRVFKNNGLLYKILDQNSKPIGVPIKASEFYSRPTLKFLEEKFKVNETKKEYCKNHVRNALRQAFYDERMTSVERLSERLKDEAIHTILRKSSEGNLYGITFIDFKAQTVVNESSLSKEFSAKGIQESCAMNILALERKYQKSNSTDSEIFQNLESQEFVKENLVAILLRGEKINDYVSKKFKQKKKRSLYKGI
ncbi:relaxase/mobilization nuclease domain-containing protein [Flavobacterium johnsoniae]|uniref:Relaxase/mobilization nuclease family protein n=1 Tax=Flavobacterium johnsoniae (strain ATCC 17061 / DSM 2064 / JCM 8514 / BCRC 14874 / CCUG 350202 / NBRC 14942 / NCIMB 11054 / UW101) TaxID=376686 RepID=A5FDM1_FLAJ1|nr:relaxase/mobilization nuclease domain-containing protein [Flavobacterium johnsoniae]ABQ06699.1 Relaxase/mobilization nuclease family protein [Flavobacterium johnsoniae UW101]OXE99937.1 relaxase [Flavobacterium johnsoniae UW101]WQG82456.1 relaxase/mobilization nuclease domain-containing protein [Flavobacterium johnsoniae UW101]SHM01817.1 Relaxase/Mobilisation nuclease domain-containing protein [Flavobacterium johnsoniae]